MKVLIKYERLDVEDEYHDIKSFDNEAMFLSWLKAYCIKAEDNYLNVIITFLPTIDDEPEIKFDITVKAA